MLAAIRRHWAYTLSVLVHAAVVTVLIADFAPAPAAPTPIIELRMEAQAMEEVVPVSDPLDVVTTSPPPPPPPPPPPDVVELVEPPPVIESRVESAPVIAPPPRKPVPKPRLVAPLPIGPSPLPPVADAPPVPTAEVKPVEMAAVVAPPVPAAPVPAQPQRAALSGLGGPPPEYQMLLAQRLNRFKIYPVMAQKRGQRGHAHLRFRVGRDGRVVSWSLDKSSGHQILDAEAQALVQRASPMPPPPADLADAALEFVVPIQFDLPGR